MNLKDNELNYSQLPSKKELVTAYSNWFDSRKDWELFTLTAVFKAGGRNSNPNRWTDEYKKLLWKIKRQFAHSDNDKLIPFEDFFYYECEQSSLFKSASGKHTPHHIHGIVPIPTPLAHKIWNFQTHSLRPRLQKDFESIRSLSSVQMDLMREGETALWISYISKGKPFYQM